MWTNKDTAQVLTVATIVISGIEKALSYLGQQNNSNFWEANPVSATLFTQTGLLYGHLILFAISALAAISLYLGVVFAEKIVKDRDRRICTGMLAFALFGVTVFTAIVAFNNIMLIFGSIFI